MRAKHKFQILADALKQLAQLQGVPSFSGGQIGGRNIKVYNLI